MREYPVKKSIKDINLNGKRIFLRVDMNVPIKNNSVDCSHKIVCTLPTINYILGFKIKQLIIGTHLGRPKGRDESCSVKPVVEYLNNLINEEFVLGELNEQRPEKLIFLENLRFFKEEKEGYGDWFVNRVDLAVIDSFGCAHRNDKSMTGTGVPTYMGLLMEKELNMVSTLSNVEMTVFGGAKISDKLKLIGDIPAKKVWLVGAICYTVLKKGFGTPIGKSLSEEVDISEILKLNLGLPQDFVVKNNEEYSNKSLLDADDIGVDIGLETQKEIEADILNAKSVFWNGPAGLFEDPQAANGTKVIAEALKEIKKQNKVCYIGGGETAMAALRYGNPEDYTHVSTGGGALMAMLSGADMPGIDAIQDR